MAGLQPVINDFYFVPFTDSKVVYDDFLVALLFQGELHVAAAAHSNYIRCKKLTVLDGVQSRSREVDGRCK